MKIDENVMDLPVVLTEIDASAIEGSKSSALHGRWAEVLRSPIWLCLLLALGVRVWLVIDTHGFMDADEALLGVQAQHILHGERPNPLLRSALHGKPRSLPCGYSIRTGRLFSMDIAPCAHGPLVSCSMADMVSCWRVS